MERELHFGMFHTGLEKGREGFEFALKNPALDLFICECDYRGEVFDTQLREIAAAGKKAFITFSYLLFRRVSKEEMMVDVGGEYYAKCVLQPDYRERLAEMKRKIAEAVGRPLDLWVVCYEDKLDSIPNIEEYLRVFDVITYWTWKGSELSRIEKNLARIRKMAPNARILCGCYMWNYGEHCALTRAHMEYQTDLYLRMMRAGEIEGIVVCSNCIADLGIENVEYMREWIAAHKDEVL